LLGEAKANEAGRFLVESKKQVAVGTQILRADSLGADGQVTARASVPFERVDGEKLAMVAPVEEPVETLAATPKTATETAVATTETPLADAPVVSPALTRVDTSVIIRKGDTLWQIARRVYGKGVTFSTIYNANVAQITDPNRIFPGQVFAVPRNTEAGETADFQGIEGQKKEDVVVE
jgi:nucleoid-associated protein YgaU